MGLTGDGRFESDESGLDESEVLEVSEGSRSASEESSEMGLNCTSSKISERRRRRTITT